MFRMMLRPLEKHMTNFWNVTLIAMGTGANMLTMKRKRAIQNEFNW